MTTTARFSSPYIIEVTRDGRVFYVPDDMANADRLALDLEGVQIASYEPPAPTPQAYGLVIQAHLDATARARGYDGALSVVSYAGSAIPAWAGEAAAFIAWRDAVWAYAYGELAKVQAQERAAPMPAELVEELPTIEWPA